MPPSACQTISMVMATPPGSQSPPAPGRRSCPRRPDAASHRHEASAYSAEPAYGVPSMLGSSALRMIMLVVLAFLVRAVLQRIEFLLARPAHAPWSLLLL